MIVVSDTSPLNYLVQINAINILPLLHEEIFIPEAVYQELLDPQTPEQVRLWAQSLPAWVSVRKPQAILPLRIDVGEREAISLALELQVTTVLMDDLKGRRMAEKQGLQVSGTVAQLGQAAHNGLLDFDEAVQRLSETNFRGDDKVVAAVRMSLGLAELGVRGQP